METEGNFLSIGIKARLRESDFQPWNFGEPNGKTLETCVSIWADKDNWNDLSCKDRVPYFCEVESVPYFTLRGMCLLLRLEHYYFNFFI